MNKLITIDSEKTIKTGLIIGLIVILPYFLSKAVENTLQIFLFINICIILFSFIAIIKIGFYYKYNRRENDIIGMYIKYTSISAIAILNVLNYFNGSNFYYIKKNVPYMCDYRIITNIIINIIIIYLYTSKSKKVVKHIYILFISIFSFTIFSISLDELVIEYIINNNNYVISIILSILNICTTILVLYLILQKSILTNDVFIKMFFIAFLFMLVNKFYILFAQYININLRLGVGIITLIISILPLISFVKYFKNNIKQQILQNNNIVKLENDFNKFKKLAENTCSFITILNKNMDIDYINSSFVSFLEQYYGKSIDYSELKEIFITSGIINLFYEKSVIVEQSEVWCGELSINLEDNVKVDFKGTIYKISDEYGYALILDAVSNYKELENILYSKEKILKIITENINELVCVLDSDGRLIYCSSSYLEKFGGTINQHKYIPWINSIDEEDKDNFNKNMKCIIDSNKHITDRCKFIKKDNKDIYIEYTISSLFNEISNTSWILLSLREIDAVLKSKNDVIINESLIDEKFKREIFSNISHELRTPINVIFSALQVLELYKGNEEFKEVFYNKYMNIIKQNCYRLLRLINNVIDIGKIDSGYYKLNMGNHDIVKIVEDITLSVVSYSENRGINVIFDTSEEEIFTSCDPDKLERIMLNLLSNAIKFTEENGTISVNVDLVDDKVTIAVKDTGTGIPEEKLDVIFERYKQAGQDIVRENEGSGIGLSLVKSLVELQGGKVQVSSEDGVGTEFVITLPINDEPTIETESLMDNREQANIQRINIEFSDIYK